MSTPSIAEVTATLTAPGSMYELDTAEIRGVTFKVWKNCPPSLRSILELSSLHGDKTFLVYEDERMTFAEHFGLAARFAHVLIEELGVTKGDRVAIAMRNFPEWSVAFWGAAAVGAGVAAPAAAGARRRPGRRHQPVDDAGEEGAGDSGGARRDR